jgi:hypothetical protein
MAREFAIVDAIAATVTKKAGTIATGIKAVCLQPPGSVQQLR